MCFDKSSQVDNMKKILANLCTFKSQLHSLINVATMLMYLAESDLNIPGFMVTTLIMKLYLKFLDSSYHVIQNCMLNVLKYFVSEVFLYSTY